jgi:hemoglobin-like flavoprotein
MASNPNHGAPVAAAPGGAAWASAGWASAAAGGAYPGSMGPRGTGPGGTGPGGTGPRDAASGGGATPGAIAPLDPAVWDLIRFSAARLTSLEEAFIRQLHADITALIPGRADAMWGFCQRMVQSVLWAALTDQSLSVVAETLRRVGAANQAEGFPGDQYVNVAHALVRAVRDLSGDNWSTSMGSAWISYFLWIRPHLIAGAEQIASQQAAAAQEAARHASARLEAARQAAAQLEAARAQAPPGSWPSQSPAPTPDVDLETVATLLDDEDEEDQASGYGQIMMSMTRSTKKERPRHHD